MMTLSERGAAFIRAHEGFVPHYYRDPAGVGTIGIGFTWGSAGFRRWWMDHRPGEVFAPGARMSEREADIVLRLLADKDYGRAVNAFFGQVVPQHVFDACVSATYNLGPRALGWRWAGAAKAGDYAKAAALLRNTGTTAGGRTLPALVRRRADEALLLEKGIYGAGSDPPVAQGLWARLKRLFSIG